MPVTESTHHKVKDCAGRDPSFTPGGGPARCGARPRRCHFRSRPCRALRGLSGRLMECGGHPDKLGLHLLDGLNVESHRIVELKGMHAG
jgi:hypothetical protein